MPLTKGRGPGHSARVTLRCVFCHDDLGAAKVACAGCGALYHEECITDRCATIACGKFRRSRQEARTLVPRTPGGRGLAVLAVLFFGIPMLALGATFGAEGICWAASLVIAFVIAALDDRSSKAKLGDDASPPTAAPAPAQVVCVLCARPALAGATTCADHAALLEDSLGPSARIRIRPGQLYGPGQIDSGASGRPASP